MSFFRHYLFSFSASCDYINMCLYFPSGFPTSLACWTVFAARALSDLNAFVERFMVPTPACLHVQLSSVSDLSCSVVNGCIWMF